MVILIGGIGRSGKTLMAQKLIEKYHFPYLSIDHLKMGIYRGDRDCGFTPLDNDDLIAAILWPIIKGIIMTNIENDQNIVIEGCYLFPHHINDLESEYSEQIISVFLGFSFEYIRKNYVTNIVQNESVIEYRGTAEEVTDESIQECISLHEDLKRRCSEHHSNYFQIKQDYELEISQVYDFIESQKQAIESKFNKRTK